MKKLFFSCLFVITIFSGSFSSTEKVEAQEIVISGEMYKASLCIRVFKPATVACFTPSSSSNDCSKPVSCILTE